MSFYAISAAWRTLAASIVRLALAGTLVSCSAPERRLPQVSLRQEAPLAGLPQQRVGWPEANWWEKFHDPQLTLLMERALTHSPALDVALTRYRVATIAVESARADAQPQLNGIGSVSRAKIDESASPNSGGGAAGAQGLTLPSYVTSGSAIADFSWDMDWWGKHRAAIESAIDQAHAALAERSAAAWLTQYALATVYMDWLGQQNRLLQSEQNILINTALLQIASSRVARGVDSPQTLESARQQLSAARQSRAQLKGSADVDAAQLAALLGISPSDLPPLSRIDLPSLDLGLPDDARVWLLARRPDVVASRWMVESAARNIDEARAAFFPDISINALAGFLRSFPEPGSPSSLKFGSVGISASLPIFDGGRIKARYDESQAQLDAAIAQYNASVIAAAQDVSRETLTLTSLEALSDEKRTQVEATEMAYRQAQARDRQGVDDPRQALSAHLQLVNQRDEEVQLHAQVLATDIALIRALGGGYQRLGDPAAAAGDMHPTPGVYAVTDFDSRSATPVFQYKYKYQYKYGSDYAPKNEASSEKEGDSSSGDSSDQDSSAEGKKTHSVETTGEDGKPAKQDEDNDKKQEAKGEEKNSPAQKRKKMWIFGGIAVVIVLLGLIWLLLYLLVFSKRQTTDDAYVGGDQVAVASKINGTVVDVLIDDTEPVRAGQVLVRLDPADAGADLIRAEGALAQAVRQVQQQIHSAAEADAMIAARQADVDKANDDYKRRQPLLAEHATAAEDVSSALQQLRSARAALDQAKRQAQASHAAVDGVAVANNPSVIQAKAQYVNAWINNSRNTIIAPIDGYAAQREVQVGQQVQPGERLLTIVPLDHLWIDANFKESQLAGIRIGQPAEVSADMYPGDVVFHGRVVGLAAGTGSSFALLPPQNASGNWIKIVQRLPVRISLDPSELRKFPLRVGLSTYTKVDIHDQSGSVLSTAPREAALASTTVYEEEFRKAANAADVVIERNIVGPATLTHVND